MGVVEDFLTSYRRDFHNREKVARLAEEQCRQFIEVSAIRAIVSSRAKNPDRLRAKLEKRIAEEGKTYETSAAIQNDMHDLSGVRIALYSPTDAVTVGK